MKPITSDPIVKRGLAIAVQKALESADPVSALEKNIERVAHAIVSGKAANGDDGFWNRALADEAAQSCGCSTAAEPVREAGLEEIAQLEEGDFAKATQGKRWEELMRG